MHIKNDSVHLRTQIQQKRKMELEILTEQKSKNHHRTRVYLTQNSQTKVDSVLNTQRHREKRTQMVKRASVKTVRFRLKTIETFPLNDRWWKRVNQNLLTLCLRIMFL